MVTTLRSKNENKQNAKNKTGTIKKNFFKSLQKQILFSDCPGVSESLNAGRVNLRNMQNFHASGTKLTELQNFSRDFVPLHEKSLIVGTSADCPHSIRPTNYKMV